MVKDYKMQAYTIILVIAALAMTSSSAIPKPADGKAPHKSRVHDEDEVDADWGNEDYASRHLPNERHIDLDKHLSEAQHYRDDEEDDDHHESDYDHEAFMGGKEEAHEFDKLSPEESKEALSAIFDKIDKDSNGAVNEQELREWVRFKHQEHIKNESRTQWGDQEVGKDNLLTWPHYEKHTYGFMDGEKEDPTYVHLKARDRKRWALADANKDGKLTLDEYTHFLHPEDFPHMKSIVGEETIDDLDKDKDGKISLEEFMNDVYPPEEREPTEPEWVVAERKKFADVHDKDKNGFLDKKEVELWIIPEDFDHSAEEARHLISEADMDKDKILSKEEVLEKYDVFVSSQATNFGQALHDEF